MCLFYQKEHCKLLNGSHMMKNFMISSFFILCMINYACAFACSPNVCQNGGSCKVKGNSEEECICEKRYFGIICDKYSSSYTIFLHENQENILPRLSELFLNNGLPHAELVLDATNTALNVIFYVQNLNINTLKTIYQSDTKVNAAVISIRDFDECDLAIDEVKDCGIDGKTCVNTIGSFSCSCGNDYIEEDGVCVDNSLWVQTETQIWLIVVGSALVVLIIMITIIHRKRYKVKMFKRKQREQDRIENQQKYLQRSQTLSSGSSKPLQQSGSLPNYPWLEDGLGGPRLSTQSDVFDEVSNGYNNGAYYNDKRYSGQQQQMLNENEQQMKYFLNRGYSIDQSRKLASLTSKNLKQDTMGRHNKYSSGNSLSKASHLKSPKINQKFVYPSKSQSLPRTPRQNRRRSNDPSLNRVSSWDPLESNTRSSSVSYDNKPSWDGKPSYKSNNQTFNEPYITMSYPQQGSYSYQNQNPLDNIYDVGSVYVTDHVTDGNLTAFNYGDERIWDNPYQAQNDVYNPYN